MGKVNCDTDSELEHKVFQFHSTLYSIPFISIPMAGDLCSNPFHITKYPTLKIVRYGMVGLYTVATS